MDTEPEATGQRVITSRHACSHRTREHSHTNHLPCPHQFSPPHPCPLHAGEHICNRARSACTYCAPAERTAPLFSTCLLLILLFILPSAAEPASVAPLDKPAWFPLPRLRLFICSSPAKQTAVRVQQIASRYRYPAATTKPHELWIGGGGGVRWRSGRSHRGQSPGPLLDD